MVIESLILIQGESVKKENLAISLANAKQIVLGSVNRFGFVVHLAASSTDDLSNALLRFAKVKDVTGVITMMVRP
ncbi:hypothetical protein [Spirosoma validum]|uniref:Uncharacterized protein n=1 Tax=Spirosoma validum TaxID=2771355 RepID=A0A927GFL5_9BACT|nr:hypothetical protein [Spirosoma validum]MBD2755921.1 hypothetical protein [Spirosoma validum]